MPMSFGGKNPVKETQAEFDSALREAGIPLDDELKHTTLSKLASQTAARLASEHLKRVSASLRPLNDIDIDRLQIHLWKEVCPNSVDLDQSQTFPQMQQRLQRMFRMVFAKDQTDEKNGEKNNSAEQPTNISAEQPTKNSAEQLTNIQTQTTWTAAKAMTGYIRGAQKALSKARSTTLAPMMFKQITPTELYKMSKSAAAYVLARRLEQMAQSEQFELSDEMKQHNDNLGKSPKQLFYDTLNSKLKDIVTTKHSVPSIESLWDSTFATSIDRDHIYENMVKCAKLPEHRQPKQTEVERCERRLRHTEFVCIGAVTRKKMSSDYELKHKANLDAAIAKYNDEYNAALEAQTKTMAEREQRKQEQDELKHEQTEELKHAEETEHNNKAQFEKMQSKNQKHSDEFRNLKRKIMNLEHQLEKEKQKYEVEREKLQHTNKDQSNQIRNFKLAKVHLEEQLEKEKQKYEDERAKVEVRNRELLRALSNQKSAAARIADLEATIKKLKAAQQEQREQIERELIRNRAHTKSLAERDAQVQELREKVRELEVSLAAANTKIETFKTENTKLSKNIGELQSSSVKHKLEMKELTTKTDRQRRDSKVCIDRMQIELIEAKGQIEELQIMDRAAKMETDAVERSNDDLKEQIKQLTRENEQLRSQKQGLADQIGRFEAQRQIMEATFANKDQMIKDLKEQMKQLTREKEHFEEQRQSMETTIANKDQMIEDLNEQMEQLSRENELTIDRVRQNGNEEIDRLKAKIEDQDKQHKQAMKARDGEVKEVLSRIGEIRMEHQNFEAAITNAHDASFAEMHAKIQKQYEDEKHRALQFTQTELEKLATEFTEALKEREDELKQVRWQRDQNREHIAKISGRIVDLEKAIEDKEKAYEMLSESKMELAKHTQHAMQEMRGTISLLTKRKELASSSAAPSETRWSLTSSLDEMMPFAKTWLPAFRS